MAITANDIHNQSFSIDRKGYDVDEVDVFLEHVAEEIDELNALIAHLEQQLDEVQFAGFDEPVAPEEDYIEEPVVAAAPVEVASSQEFEEALAEKDAIIAQLERQLEEKKANDNAIAQALIVAQRSADDVVARANSQAAETVQDAREEAQRILDRANKDRQDVIDSIRKLQDDREDAREEYADLLSDIIDDATRKLASIGMPLTMAGASHAYTPQPRVEVLDPEDTGDFVAYSAPVEYTTPQAGAAVAVATPVASAYEKDLSGFGDVDEFEFEEID